MTMPTSERATTKPLLHQSLSIEGFLADSVTGTPDGKLQVQGGAWNTIQTSIFPFRQPRIGIAAIIAVPYDLATPDPRGFAIRLENADSVELPIADAPPGMNTPDGKIRRIGGQFVVSRPPGVQQGDEQLVVLALNVDGLTFDAAGIYRFVFSIDDHDLKALRFRVNYLPSAAVLMS